MRGKDPELKKQALRRGLESGINFVHSCMEYGTWPVLADVLDDWPERRQLVHAIKMILPEDEDEQQILPG